MLLGRKVHRVRSGWEGFGRHGTSSSRVSQHAMAIGLMPQVIGCSDPHGRGLQGTRALRDEVRGASVGSVEAAEGLRRNRCRKRPDVQRHLGRARLVEESRVFDRPWDLRDRGVTLLRGEAAEVSSCSGARGKTAGVSWLATTLGSCVLFGEAQLLSVPPAVVFRVEAGERVYGGLEARGIGCGALRWSFEVKAVRSAKRKWKFALMTSARPFATATEEVSYRASETV